MTGLLLQDLRYGARLLGKTPSFTLIVIFTLALGIGANTAIFTIANALLFRPLPYEDPGRLVIVTNARGPNRRPFSHTRARFIQEHSRSLAGLAPFALENFNLTGKGEPELLPSARVGWNFFDVLGVRPRLGRGFRREEDLPGSQPVVIISDSLWKRRFGAAPHVTGQSLTLDSVDTTIIGVMPPDFEFAPLGRSTDIWSTRTFEMNSISGQIPPGTSYLIAIARIGAGVSLDQAQAEMGVLDAQYRRENQALADADPRQHIGLNPVQDLMVADVRNAVLILFGAVACVLLIACANVASLLLSRAVGRRKEIATRIALGASRTGIVRQLLTENIFIAAISGALGVLLGVAAVRAVNLLPPSTIPRINPIRIDGEVLLFLLAVSLLTGLAFGLAPALQLSGTGVQGVLREEGRGVTGGRWRNLTRYALVASQVALSLVLLVGAALLMRSFQKLQNVTLGFNPDRMILMDVALPRTRYATDSQMAGFYYRCIDKFGQMPGIREVALSSALPLRPSRYAQILPEGQPEVPLAQRPLLSIQSISSSYFETMGIPLLHGRFFNSRDSENAPAVAIVNEVFARRYWPRESAVGKHVVVGPSNQRVEIVGVSGNVKNIRLAVITTPELYYPLAQKPARSMHLILRASVDPRALMNSARAQILTVDKDQSVTNVRTMEEFLGEAVAQNRLTMLVLSIFSGVALLVATVGLYGLVSYSVAQRTQELGIRLALGANPRNLLASVMLRGLLPALLGVLIGLGGSFGLTRLMSSLLYEISATDGWTFGICAALFLAIALVASYVPARRAAQVDAAEALRCE